LKTTFLSRPFLAGSLLLLVWVTSLYGQNAVTLSASTVFLNATQNAGPVQVTVTATSSPGTVGISVAPPVVPWLTVTQGTANTPTTFVFAGNPAGLAPAVYSTVVSVITPSSTIPVQVVMTVNALSSLTVNPSGLIFNYAQGSGTPLAQFVAVSSSSPSLYNVSGTAKWLLFSTSGQTAPGAPGSVSVNVDPTSLGGPGVYVAGVTITPANGIPPVIVPVVFYYLGSPQITATPASLVFNFQLAGPLTGANNITQKTITLSSGGQSITFGASGTVTTQGAPWLTVTPTQGATPAQLTATVQAAIMPEGKYQGTITVTAPGASNPSLTIPVTLTVSAMPLLDLNLSNLAFTYQVGTALPPDQFITPNSTTGNTSYTVAVSTNNTGNWLNATGNGVTPTPVDVSVNPVGLPPGTYTGTLGFSALNGANNPQVVTVTLTIVNNPTLLTTPNTATGLTFNLETGQNPPGPQTVSVTSSGAPLGFVLSSNQNTTSNGVNWLLVGTPSSATTPSTFTIGVNATGMAVGQYLGTVTMSTPGGGIQVTLPVTLNITPAGTALVFTSPKALTFSILQGGTADNQLVSVNTTGEPVPYNPVPNVTTPTGGSWLIAGPASAPASATNISNFFVGVNASTLLPGAYKGIVTVQTTNGTPNVLIPVTLTVSTGNLILSSTTLSFTQASFGAAPPAQTFGVTSSGTPLAINAFASGGSWLSVSPANGNTPAAFAVTVNSGNLAAGSYTGQINIVSAGAGNSPQAVLVNLTVTTAQSLTVSTGAAANSLTFTSATGAPAPAPQTVGVTASGGSLSFLANVGVTSPTGGNWLSVSPTNGTASSTATNLTVSVNPQGLNPGTYTGTVSISSPNANNSPQVINVTYVVTTIPTPAPASVLNGGSFQTGAVAPGEIITIKGTNLGPPAPGVSGTAGSNNLLATLVSDTQVTFDNVAAPLLYVSATQINVIVPYEVDGRAQTRVIVTYKGTASAALVLNVTDTAPGIFPESAPGYPATQGAILNADGSLNGPDNPAAPGASIVIYATGEGQTTPAGVNGLIVAPLASALKKPNKTVSVTVDGQPAEVQYAGSAPGFVSGALQINVVVPPGAASNPTAAIVVTIGSNSSGGGTTVAVR
jgi:uncharacterized protein (TIGR03437 family)